MPHPQSVKEISVVLYLLGRLSKFLHEVLTFMEGLAVCFDNNK